MDNRIPKKRCKLLFYDMDNGDAVAADWLVLYTTSDCVPMNKQVVFSTACSHNLARIY